MMIIAKRAAGILLAGALMLPLAGFAADGDSDRSSPSAFVKDSVITAKIKAQLAEEKLSTLVKIRVDTDKRGAVVLSGTAPDQASVDKALLIAHNVKGVYSVRNRIQIKADK